jgi:hypothetical protein
MTKMVSSTGIVAAARRAASIAARVRLLDATAGVPADQARVAVVEAGDAPASSSQN